MHIVNEEVPILIEVKDKNVSYYLYDTKYIASEEDLPLSILQEEGKSVIIEFDNDIFVYDVMSIIYENEQLKSVANKNEFHKRKGKYRFFNTRIRCNKRRR